MSKANSSLDLKITINFLSLRIRTYRHFSSSIGWISAVFPRRACSGEKRGLISRTAAGNRAQSQRNAGCHMNLVQCLCFGIAQWQRLWTSNQRRSQVRLVSPVVQRPISAQARVKFNPGFFCSKVFSRVFWSVLLRASNHQLVDKKN